MTLSQEDGQLYYVGWTDDRINNEQTGDREDYGIGAD